MAEARRKQGRHAEAVTEVRRQLARFPDDLQGILLLAEIQALNLKDLPAAEQTLEDWLAAKPRDPGHQAIILTKLADWSLLIGKDVRRARDFLERIRDHLPETEVALLAEQRLAHLTYEAAPRTTTLRLDPGLGAPVDIGQPPAVPEQSLEPEAADLVKHLVEHPHDVTARERLASLYAWHYQRPDLARAELEALIGLPQAPAREITHWLNLLADIEIQVAGDLAAARGALQRIIDRNPNSAAAEQARVRIPMLPRELSRRSGPRTISCPTSEPSEPWSSRNRGAVGPRL
jgi:tetratricopeptide (TPR) repeat protein